ncbi:MAG: hypothetical protein RI947_1075 [Candidatus Parcubacteria bacterium]|jgi:thioredoxin reductase (NADPH)
MSDTQHNHEVIIIGGGPAGLSAALYNARANMKPLVFAGSPPGGQLTLTSDVENFPGHESIMGPELVEKIRAQVLKFGTVMKDENVLSLDFTHKPFTVKTTSGVYTSKAILIATGAKALWLGLDSEQKLRGKGVSACATCDGFFFRNKTTAVIGGGDTAMEDAMTMTKFAEKVYVIHRRGEFRASKIMQERVLNHPKIEVIWNAAVEQILGEQKVEGIKLLINGTEAREIALQGVFVAIGHKPDTELFKNHIELDSKGYIVTSAVKALAMATGAKESSQTFDFGFQYMTSIPGVFAAGDCVDHVYRQAATAAGMGVAAGLEVERWLETHE